MNRIMNTSKYRKIIGVAIALIATVTLNAHSDAFKPAFVDSLVKPYLEIQKSLAGDNLEGAQTAASAFVEVMNTAPQAVPPEESDDLATPARGIESASDISSARKSFEELSMEFTSLVTHVGTSGKTPLFVANCPMAFGGKGASWIQEDTTVANPYYGARMLKCGSVKKQIAGEKSDHKTTGEGHEHMGHGHGMTEKSGDTYSLANLDSVHAGVPGYHDGLKASKSQKVSGESCGMSCCSTDGGN
jgi:Cu(I)/Ag(I) efflux system membrane fusion protein